MAKAVCTLHGNSSQPTRPARQLAALSLARVWRVPVQAEAAREAEEVKAAAEKVERAAQAKAETEAEKRLFAFATGPSADGSGGDGDGGGERSGSADSSADSSADAVLAAWVAAHPEDPVPSIAEKRQLAQRTGEDKAISHRAIYCMPLVSPLASRLRQG